MKNSYVFALIFVFCLYFLQENLSLRPVFWGIQEAETRTANAQVQGLHGLQSEFKANLWDSVRPHVKVKNEKWGRNTAQW